MQLKQRKQIFQIFQIKVYWLKIATGTRQTGWLFTTAIYLFAYRYEQ